MIRAGSGAACTPCSSQALQARFSRLVTRDKVFSRLDIELFRTLVADHRALLATLAADALLRRADNDLFDPGQIRR